MPDTRLSAAHRALTTYRRQLICLATALTASFAPGVELRAQVAPTVETVQQEFNEAYRSRNFRRAAQLGEELLSLAAESETAHYNVACVRALAGDPGGAAKALARSIELGFRNLDLLETDTDLDSLRETEGFAALVSQVRVNHAAALAEFEKQARKRDPIIVSPRRLRRRAPVVVALHGFGGTAESFAGVYGKAARDAGAILVVPRAVYKAPQGGYEWGTADEANILIERAIKLVRREHSIDEERIVLTGFSQGGFIAWQLGLSRPERFKGVIPVAGSYRGGAAADRGVAGKGQRFYIMVGGDDRAAESSRQAAKDLESAGVPVHLEVFEGVGHSYPKGSDQEVAKALEFVLADDG